LDKNTKTIVIILAVVAFMGIVMLGVDNIDKDVSLANSKCPITVDEVTTLISVKRDFDTIIMRYEIHDAGVIFGAIANVASGGELKRFVQISACTNPFIQKYGMNVRTEYFTTEGVKFVDVVTTEEMCK